VGGDVLGAHPGRLSQHPGQGLAGFARSVQAPDRRELGLGVELETLFVDPPVEVDGKLRHSGERLVQAHRHGAAIEQV
jgi:hypothetical protein